MGLLVWLGASPGVVCWLALALTYLVHSLLWAAAAALMARRATLSSATRHLFWKMALFGPLVTALVASAASPSLERALGGASCVREISWLTVSGTAPSPEVRGWATSVLSPKSSVPAVIAHSQAELVVACGLGAAGLGLLRFLATMLLLRRRLQGRPKVADARLLRRLGFMRARTEIRWVELTESPLIGSPFVIGTGEICIPHGLLAALTDAEVDAVLAHELAHLEPSLARRLASVPAMVRSRSALLPRVRRLTTGGASARQVGSGRGRLWPIATITALSVALGSLSVRVAQARRTERPGQPAHLLSHSSLSPDPPSAPPPDAEGQTKRMAELTQREEQLTMLVAAAQRRPDAQERGHAWFGSSARVEPRATARARHPSLARKAVREGVGRVGRNSTRPAARSPLIRS